MEKQWDEFIEFMTEAKSVSINLNISVNDMIEVYKVLDKQEYFKSFNVKGAANVMANCLNGFDQFLANGQA